MKDKICDYFMLMLVFSVMGILTKVSSTVALLIILLCPALVVWLGVFTYHYRK